MPLTEVAIRNARIEQKAARIYDERGLYLQLAQSGGKWWRFKYRFGSKEKLLSLGTYPEVSLKQARLARDEARALVRSGTDPSAARKSAKIPVSSRCLPLKDVIKEWLEHRRDGWTPGTFDAIAASLTTHVYPTLGDCDVAEVSSADIRRCVVAIGSTGATETASRVLQRLRSVYRFAMGSPGRTAVSINNCNAKRVV